MRDDQYRYSRAGPHRRGGGTAAETIAKYIMPGNDRNGRYLRPDPLARTRPGTALTASCVSFTGHVSLQSTGPANRRRPQITIMMTRVCGPFPGRGTTVRSGQNKKERPGRVLAVTRPSIDGGQ